mgnify:CR=1 FL=1
MRELLSKGFIRVRIKWFSLVRITGLILVLIYHFFKDTLPGGFIGVDVFFTFSGYLITALLIDEFARYRDIDYVGFLRRRFYRIVPPLVFMILVVTPFMLLLRNDFLSGIKYQIAAALGFVTNYFEIMLGSSYENQFAPHVYLHTWSLAVEMHFYILWGLAAWLISRMSKTISGYKLKIASASCVLLVAAYLGMSLGAPASENLSIQYFSTQTHIFPFFIGALLSCIAGISQTSGLFNQFEQKLSKVHVLIGLVISITVLVILSVFLHFDSLFTYTFGFLFASLAAASMIFFARMLHQKTENVKEPALISFVADTSYGVYLFHWPLYILFAEKMNSMEAAAVTTVLSFMLASCSFYILEPALAGKSPHVFGNRQLNIQLVLRVAGVVLIPCAVVVAFISVTAPQLSDFQKDLLLNTSLQEQSSMVMTRKHADSSQASNYNVVAGVTYIGDSVSLRARSYLQEALPDAQIDASVSRNVSMGVDVLQTAISNNSLYQDVVVALGANPVGGTDAIDKIVGALPRGHRLIFVTPYDGRTNDPNAGAWAIRAHELELAQQYDFITIADWAQVAQDNPDLWNDTDYVHFGSDSESINRGGTLYAQMVKDAIAKADQGHVKP